MANSWIQKCQALWLHQSRIIFKSKIKDGNWAGCPTGRLNPTVFGPGSGQAFHGILYLGPAQDDPIKGRAYLGCVSGRTPQSLAYPEVRTDPGSYSVCDPAPASASAGI
ncbi:hypothetical protein PGT21_013640 [Puccinia graminis f. sp. tritici]|uniref:Uncharacterized protein n=1 Tax=Puccinia graminis f. sp. tritici TaxID=56615 RepID=A0A5B0NPL1_PUCGR|nr:hypothetical protein PGT21_013640 [Puccinia graminis f. sp. tritici]